MENIFHIKISLSSHCYLHINVAFYFSEGTAIQVCLHKQVILLMAKKKVSADAVTKQAVK